MYSYEHHLRTVESFMHRLKLETLNLHSICSLSTHSSYTYSFAFVYSIYVYSILSLRAKWHVHKLKRNTFNVHSTKGMFEVSRFYLWGRFLIRMEKIEEARKNTPTLIFIHICSISNIISIISLLYNEIACRYFNKIMCELAKRPNSVMTLSDTRCSIKKRIKVKKKRLVCAFSSHLQEKSQHRNDKKGIFPRTEYTKFSKNSKILLLQYCTINNSWNS